MASELRVNTINSRTGFGTITVSETGQDLVGITTIENLTAENTLVGAAASFTGNVSVGGVLTYEDVTNIDSVGLITARQGIEIGARPGVAASISVDGNMIVSGISTFQATTVTSLDVSAGLGIAESLFHLGDTDTRFAFPAADTIALDTGGSERARIDSSGRFLLGHTSDIGYGFRSQLVGTDGNTSSSSQIRFTASASGSTYILAKSRNGTPGSKTIVQSGDNLGEIQWRGDDGVDYKSIAASISAGVDGTPGAGDMPGRLVFSTTADGAEAATERLRIHSTGSVTLGKTSTAGKTLEVYSGSDAAIRVQNSTTGTGSNDGILLEASGSDALLYNYEAGYLAFGTSGSERLRITSGGQILMGATTAYNVFENSATAPRVQVRGSDLNGSCQAWIRATADAGAPKLFLANTRSTSQGGQTIVQSGDELGQITFCGSDGSQFVNGCEIRGAVDGTPGADDMPGRLTFHTTKDGETGGSEWMRIDSDGKVMINTSDNALGGVTGNLNVANTNTNNHTVINCSRNTANDRNQIRFLNPNGNVGSVTSSGTSTSFNTSSDYRLKENEVSISDGITRLKQLKPYRFNFKTDSSTILDGFFAHEVSSIVPEAITGTKDAVVTQAMIDAGDFVEGTLNNPIHQGIDHSKLVPLLVASLQESITEIETLKTKVAALESA